MLIKLDDMYAMVRETPRAEATLILLLLTSVNIIAVFGLLDIFIKMPVLPGKKIYGMLLFTPIAAINFLLIFYKQRYKKIEAKLSPVWKEEKGKNILITILYIIFTVIFFIVSAQYAKNHSIR